MVPAEIAPSPQSIVAVKAPTSSVRSVSVKVAIVVVPASATLSVAEASTT